MDKEKEMNEFGDLLYNVLWAKKPIHFTKRLEKMIIEKKQFSFTKEELINSYIMDATIDLTVEYDWISFYQLEFFKDSYDAVTFRTTDYSTVLLLRERLLEFKKIVLKPLTP